MRCRGRRVNRLRSIARGAAGCAPVVGYEAGAHYAVTTPGLQGVGLALVVVPALAVVLGIAARSPRRAWLLPLVAVGTAALWLARGYLERHYEWGLYLEHVLFNGALGYCFGRTLARGREPLCSQFAAMARGGPLMPEIAAYTRRVTVAWTLFFAAVIGVSTLLFATASIETWSTFANYLTLPLAALFFVVEHAWRRFALPGVRSSGMLASIRAYRRSTGARAAEP